MMVGNFFVLVIDYFIILEHCMTDVILIFGMSLHCHTHEFFRASAYRVIAADCYVTIHIFFVTTEIWSYVFIATDVLEYFLGLLASLGC